MEGEEMTEGSEVTVLSDDMLEEQKDLVWKTGKSGKARLVIPQSAAPDLLALLVHAQHGHQGVVAIVTTLLKE